jgi:filamentous hemagglutinin
MTNAPKGSTATAPSVATNTGTTGSTGAASVVASADDVGVASVVKATGGNGSAGGTTVSAVEGNGGSSVKLGSSMSVEASTQKFAEEFIAAGQTKKPAAISVAGYGDYQTPPFTNLNVGKATSFPGVVSNSDGTLSIANVDQFMNGINDVYKSAGQVLNPATVQSIRNYITSKPVFDVQAGIPGTHAEVQSLNNIYNTVPASIKSPSQINISTYKLGPSSTVADQGGPFPACTNCGNIIPSSANITTGKN